MKLTIKEALEQGYIKCGYDEREWQSLMDIEDLSPDDFNNDKKIILADKESQSTLVDSEYLKDLLADNISSMHQDEIGDDTDSVYDSIKAIEFESTAVIINNTLSVHRYWNLTEIELIP